MANKPLSRQVIELDIEQSDQTKRNIDDIYKSFDRLQAYADDLSFDDANKEAEKLSKTIMEIAQNSENSADEIAAYGKAAEKAVKSLETQATKLTYSMSEQGKIERERLKELKTELSTLGQSNDAKKRRKEIEQELKRIQKNVVDLSDQELQDAYKANKAARARLKLSQQEARIAQTNQQQNKKLSELVKQDLASLKEKLKLQMKFIQSLKTTEGRYKAIKAAAGKIGAGAKKAGKAAAFGIGMLGAITGGAMAGASSAVDVEKEANRIKTHMNDEDKRQLLSNLYISTGADYTTIVDAINRVVSVLGKDTSIEDMTTAATAEIRYPGAAAIIRQQNDRAGTKEDFARYNNKMKAIQAQTGASVDQITESSAKVANMRQSSFSNASQTDLQALYLTLQNSGAYDTAEELDRVFRAFVRVQKDSGKGVFELAEEWTRNGEFLKRSYGATNKQQAKQALSTVDWGNIAQNINTNTTDIQSTSAETAAAKVREIEETKNKLLMKLLEAIAPVIKSLNVEHISEFIAWLITKMAPMLEKEAEALNYIVDVIRDIYTKIENSPLLSDNAKKIASILNPLQPALNLMSTLQEKSNGGLITMTSITGERGPEMVIPMDPARFARGKELTQNLVQHFHLQGNETTSLSLSQMVKSRDFTRSMMNNSYINTRLGR